MAESRHRLSETRTTTQLEREKERKKERDSPCSHRAVVGVDLVQQSHDLVAQHERSGVAGQRRRAVRQANRAEDAEEGGHLQPHVAAETVSACFCRLSPESFWGLRD